MASDDRRSATMAASSLQYSGRDFVCVVQGYAVRFLKNNTSVVPLGLAEAPATPDRISDLGILSWKDHLTEENLFYVVSPGAMETYRNSIESHLAKVEKTGSCIQEEVETSMYDTAAVIMPRTIMPRTKRTRPEIGESSNPVPPPQQQDDGYPTNDFYSYHYEQANEHFIRRPIVTGRNVKLPSQYDSLLIGKLDTMGWLPLNNLPSKIYPRLVQLFYVHLTAGDQQNEPWSLTSYVKGKRITLSLRRFAQIIGVETGDLQCYFQNEFALEKIVDDVTQIYTTICDNRFSGTNLKVSHLKPHLRILHRWIVENVTPKKGHYNIVACFQVYLLYCFEIGQKLDLCFILLKEMMVAKLDTLSGRSLPFGALLTIIFKAHDVNLEDEAWIRITSPISEYTLTRAGGSDTLMGSLNLQNEPIPDEEEPHDSAMPPNEQPRYWTDYLALEQERYNQRLQWEQQMANQLNTLGTRFDEFGTRFDEIATAQNSLIHQFGEFRVDSERRAELTRNRIDLIDHRVTQLYHQHFPPPPTPPDKDA